MAEHMRCAVCARHLARWEFQGESEWKHALGDDDGHTPVPVPALEVDLDAVNVCDFCSSPGPEWVYHARDFSVQMVGLTDEDKVAKSVGWGSVGAWGACERCYRDIEAGKWDKIGYRWMKEWRRRGQPGAEEMLKAAQVLWDQFRANRMGEAERIR